MDRSDSNTQYRSELKKKILHEAMADFMRSGIKSVKMDDIARNMGISKRTLYEIYRNKEELLLEGVKMMHERNEKLIEDAANQENANVMSAFIAFYETQLRSIKEISPQFYDDIHKYKLVMEFFHDEHKKRQKDAAAFYTRGISEGYFRPGVDFQLVSEIWKGAMEYITHEHIYMSFPLEHIFRNVIILFLRGLCTPKGTEILDERLGRDTRLEQ